MSRWITMYLMSLKLQLYRKEKLCKSIVIILHLKANKCRWKKDLKNQDRMHLKVILMVTVEVMNLEATGVDAETINLIIEATIGEGIMIIDSSPSISQFLGFWGFGEIGRAHV
jgi:hypothetical protein